jgi:hypothetical protein
VIRTGKDVRKFRESDLVGVGCLVDSLSLGSDWTAMRTEADGC